MIIQANSYKIPLKDNSIDMAVTSPPYFGLRNYGVDPLIWDDDQNCSHEWVDASWKNPNASGGWQGGSTSGCGGSEGQKVADYHTRLIPGKICSKCKAWCGHLGLEPTPDLYVSHLVQIFREVKRVLKPMGMFFLNVGDSYSGSGQDSGRKIGERSQRIGRIVGEASPLQRVDVPGLKPKNLIGIPWKVAFALQADGWILRCDIIWQKPNPMPESVSGSCWMRHRIRVDGGDLSSVSVFKTGKRNVPYGRSVTAAQEERKIEQKWVDCPGCPKCSPNDGLVLSWNSGRPTKSHEYVFMFTKSSSYFFDQEAVREPHVRLWDASNGGSFITGRMDAVGGKIRGRKSKASYPMPNPGGRNIRSVWTIATQAYREAHFATYPKELALKCIKAGTSEKGYCPKCGMPWLRVIKKEKSEEITEAMVIAGCNPEGGYDGVDQKDYEGSKAQVPSDTKKRILESMSMISKTIAWKPSCQCNLEPVSGIVLDPFSGSATSGSVAEFLGRRYVGLELKPDYIAISKRRIAGGIKNKKILAGIPKNVERTSQENAIKQEREPLLPFPPQTKKTRVVHCMKEKYDIYIGRWNPQVPHQSEWANKYKIGVDGDRLECVEKYKRDFYSNPELQVKAVKELKGKILGCWCSPELCHGDILAAYVDSMEE